MSRRKSQAPADDQATRLAQLNRKAATQAATIGDVGTMLAAAAPTIREAITRRTDPLTARAQRLEKRCARLEKRLAKLEPKL